MHPNLCMKLVQSTKRSFLVGDLRDEISVNKVCIKENLVQSEKHFVCNRKKKDEIHVCIRVWQAKL
jgi:hypothetical protein